MKHIPNTTNIMLTVSYAYISVHELKSCMAFETSHNNDEIR
jgi:hypothetical protein